jgi:hypothetical protein
MLSPGKKLLSDMDLALVRLVRSIKEEPTTENNATCLALIEHYFLSRAPQERRYTAADILVVLDILSKNKILTIEQCKKYISKFLSPHRRVVEHLECVCDAIIFLDDAHQPVPLQLHTMLFEAVRPLEFVRHMAQIEGDGTIKLLQNYDDELIPYTYIRLMLNNIVFSTTEFAALMKIYYHSPMLLADTLLELNKHKITIPPAILRALLSEEDQSELSSAIRAYLLSTTDVKHSRYIVWSFHQLCLLDPACLTVENLRMFCDHANPGSLVKARRLLSDEDFDRYQSYLMNHYYPCRVAEALLYANDVNKPWLDRILHSSIKNPDKLMVSLSVLLAETEMSKKDVEAILTFEKPHALANQMVILHRNGLSGRFDLRQAYQVETVGFGLVYLNQYRLLNDKLAGVILKALSPVEFAKILRLAIKYNVTLDDKILKLASGPLLYSLNVLVALDQANVLNGDLLVSVLNHRDDGYSLHIDFVKILVQAKKLDTATLNAICPSEDTNVKVKTWVALAHSGLLKSELAEDCMTRAFPLPLFSNVKEYFPYKSGMSLLDWAASRDKYDLVVYLLSIGVRHCANKHGKYAIEYTKNIRIRDLFIQRQLVVINRLNTRFATLYPDKFADYSSLPRDVLAKIVDYSPNLAMSSVNRKLHTLVVQKHCKRKLQRFLEAAQQNDVTTIEKFIALGMDVNMADRSGCNALHYAVSRGQIESVEVLLKAGAKPTSVHLQVAHSKKMESLVSQFAEMLLIPHKEALQQVKDNIMAMRFYRQISSATLRLGQVPDFLTLRDFIRVVRGSVHATPIKDTLAKDAYAKLRPFIVGEKKEHRRALSWMSVFANASNSTALEEGGSATLKKSIN